VSVIQGSRNGIGRGYENPSKGILDALVPRIPLANGEVMIADY
jgi:hypothetical protein